MGLALFARAAMLVGTAVALIGCTNFEPYLRPTHSINYPPPDPKDPNVGKPLTAIDAAMQFKCLHRSGVGGTELVIDTFLAEQHEPDGCLYKFVEVTDLNALLALDDSANADKKKKLVRLIISFSRQNCNTFMARMFANREGLTFWQKLLNDFAAAASSASAFASPFAATAISGTNVVINHTMDAANATYFQAAQSAFETAVIAAMRDDETQIESKLTDTTKEYPIVRAFADLDDYGRECSIDRGLQLVNSTVQTNKDGIKGSVPPAQNQ